MPLGAALGIGGIASAGASIYGANTAANAQTNAANQANQTIRQQYAQNSQNLAPWMQNGTNANNLMSYLTGTSSTAPAGYNGGAGGQGALTQTFQPTMEQLQSTPGYQFTLGQGLKSVQNSYAAKGLGNSGAALKGAADYSSGLASNTYQQQFQNYWSQNQSIYNMLTGQSQQGLSAASALTGAGTTAAGQQSANTIGMGQAQGAAANATGSALSGLGNTIGTYGSLSNFLSNGTNNGNLSPSQFQSIGNMPATGFGSPSDAQSTAYGNYLGL